MTVTDWKNGLSGDWGTAADWVGGVVPDSIASGGSIANAGSNVTVSAGESFSVGSVTVGYLGGLTVSGRLALGGTSDTLAVSGYDGHLAVIDGTLANADVLQTGNDSLFFLDGATLDNISYAGTLDIDSLEDTATTLYVAGGLYSSGGVIDLINPQYPLPIGADALVLLDAETLNGQTIELGFGSVTENTATLTLGPQTTIVAFANGQLVGDIVNQGLIYIGGQPGQQDYDVAIETSGEAFTNASGGTIVVASESYVQTVGSTINTDFNFGDLDIANESFVNDGLIDASATVTVERGARLFELAGTIDLTGSLASFVFEGSSFALDSHGVFSGGTLDIAAGELINHGGTLAATDFILDPGATLSLNGHAVTLGGNATLAGTVVDDATNGNTLLVTGMATIGPAAPLLVESNVQLIDAGTIVQTGDITFGDSLTDTSRLIIEANAAYLMDDPGSINYDSSFAGDVTNAGLFEVTGGIDPVYADITNTGTVAAGADGVLELLANNTLGGALAGNGEIDLGANELTTLTASAISVSNLEVDGSAVLGANQTVTGEFNLLGSLALEGHVLSLSNAILAGTISGNGLGGSVVQLENGAFTDAYYQIGYLIAGATLDIAGAGSQMGGVYIDALSELNILSGAIYDSTGSIAGAGKIDISPHATAQFAGAAAQLSIVFAVGTDETLRLDGTSGFLATISGFAATDTIDLSGLVFASAAVGTVGAGGTLIITEGRDSETLNFAPSLSGSLIDLQRDMTGGTQLILGSGTIGGTPPVIVPAGAAKSNAQIGSGKSEILQSGAVLSGATIGSGGASLVLAGARMTDGVVNGVSDIYGASYGTKVNAGGYELVGSPSFPGGLADDSVINQGGYQYVLDGATASNTSITGGAAMLVGVGGTAANSVDFAGSDAVLSVAGTVIPTAVLVNFDKNGASDDAVILTGFTYAAGDTAMPGAGGMVTLDLSGQIKKLHFEAGVPNTGDSFAVTTNSLDQVVVIDPATGTTPDMDFLSPATAAGSVQIMQQVLGRASGLLLDYYANSSTSAAFQPALKNFADIVTLDALSSPAAMASLESLNLPASTAALIHKLTA